ncbi:MAG TPA: helix-turn-helix transcriptional regulator [Candidatus Limnocylindrales bacterium]|nr:helix-turn-helix transcriptional regulator [Candidatus Limnocylindrales bacterium]
MDTKNRTRNVIVVDNSHVARRVGDRIRKVRTRVGLTQAQLAKGRYTAAYISALERGLAKPSMAALTFLSERLGVSIPDLVAEERPAAVRLEADLLLASGKAQEALDRYDSLLEVAGEDRRNRAELLRGRAEALYRLSGGHEAIRPASEAAELFDALAAPADAAWARYWLAAAQYQEDNPAEARGILQELLANDRAGLDVAPDFRFRLLTQLGNVEAWDGQSQRALTYMEEARSLIDVSSLRQRAAFLSGLALQYRRVGDLERSIRVGHESLALYGAADAEREEAALENNIALTFLELGNTARAGEHLGRARLLAERHADARLLSEVAEAEARLALARGELAEASDRANEALTAAGAGGSYLAAVGAHLTLGRLAHRQGNRAGAEIHFEAAADLLRSHRAGSLLRDVLGEWADLRTAWGDPKGANGLYAEALGRAKPPT